MTWLMLTMLVVLGFALLKVRRRRKAREARLATPVRQHDTAAA